MFCLKSIAVSTLFVAPFDGSHAFSSKARSEHRIATALSAASSSSALRYRQGSDNEFVPSSLLYASADNACNDDIASMDFHSDDDIERQMEAALTTAREMDRRYGLCTEPSTRAWKKVDELYMMSAASRQVEDSVKSVLGAEKSIWSLYK
ncbi:hypothetical protein HJC23_008140 [Cyclotella cryptica]|uniref:Uncharacterized protein n=1 Tax=Cyclotella cryptica TaxID=29204 RepID=A0ABD3PJ38_9STRA|eukprot:CCRYP_013987-RA/>CCRYP_013987-RA protein AED:0.00 eAED:0.00 QI:306/1/1/1/0/0.5/2/5245/149